MYISTDIKIYVYVWFSIVPLASVVVYRDPCLWYNDVSSASRCRPCAGRALRSWWVCHTTWRDVAWRDVTISSPNVWRQFCGVNSRFAHLSKINLVPSIPRPRPAVARRSSHQKLHCTFCQLFLNLLLGRTIIYYRETVVYAY